MAKKLAHKYGSAFFEILFVRLHSKALAQISIVGRVLLYVAAAALFYLPILYLIVIKCVENTSLILYFVIALLLHVLAKFMLSTSKNIKQRFAMVKTKQRFLMRTWLIIEYVLFMWLVYLLYPLTCILMPIALLSMSIENLLGYAFIFNLFMENMEQFILVGGVISYILYIIGDGYKRIQQGFLPDYLGLYALLTVISAYFERAAQWVIERIAVDVSQFTVTFSWLFKLSNDSMKMVTSVMTLFFALRSLYTHGGTVESKDDAVAETPDKADEPTPAAESVDTKIKKQRKQSRQR